MDKEEDHTIQYEATRIKYTANPGEGSQYRENIHE